MCLVKVMSLMPADVIFPGILSKAELWFLLGKDCRVHGVLCGFGVFDIFMKDKVTVSGLARKTSKCILTNEPYCKLW